METFIIILLLIATLLLFCLVPHWIYLKKSVNKYNEHEVRMFSLNMWGMLGLLATVVIIVIDKVSS